MRKLLLAGVTALALAACSSNSAPVSLSSVASDIESIATGLNNALKNPEVVAAFPGGSLPAKVSEALTDLATVAAAAAAAPDATVTKGTVAVVESDVNAIIAATAGLNLPPPAPTILTAATILLPAIETAVGIAVPLSTAASPMTVSEARVHLITGG